VIDSEWKRNYLSLEELEYLLKYSENLNLELKTVITVSVRHYNSLKYIKGLAKLRERYSNLGLNLVAGNRLYLTEKEQKRPIAKLLKKAVKLAVKIFNDTEVFVGTEGVINIVSKLAAEHEIIPFLLMDKNLEEQITKIKTINKNGIIALYTPFLIFSKEDSDLNGMIQLADYALRRKWVRKYLTRKGHNFNQIQALFKEKKKAPNMKHQSMETLLHVFKELSIFGDMQTISRHLERLREVNIIIGFPLREEESQVRHFAEVL